MTIVGERRKHRRHAVRTNLRCQRVGRTGFEEDVSSVDVSLGGVLLLADDRLGVGDVLNLDFPVDGFDLGLRGLVVSVREAPGSPEARYVHVAFTGLSPDRVMTLSDYLDSLATAGASV